MAVVRTLVTDIEDHTSSLKAMSCGSGGLTAYVVDSGLNVICSALDPVMHRFDDDGPRSNGLVSYLSDVLLVELDHAL
jgi:hypothetical protein